MIQTRIILLATLDVCSKTGKGSLDELCSHHRCLLALVDRQLPARQRDLQRLVAGQRAPELDQLNQR
jgi:hypothetical protein